MPGANTQPEPRYVLDELGSEMETERLGVLASA